ncbi:uncharacterized protein BXZ73DRAFT_96139 [Epithele typhae]|uniref:uncharacterized protein n=1 Tax=Epithele typhae TaxID=378194 RepID=UPI0020078E46|nr:uncharacterized protein BXZ73DRAFT_96139 [Epithele typhae]KAH9945149.1 hypothetical protein BXZ73DRAFT_96139 [Epithele typhae]
MYSTLLSVALFSTLAIRGALADFNVDTPTVVACQDVQLKWDSDGSKSYDVAIVPADEPCGTVLVDLGDHTINHITWKNVTLKPDTTVMISVLSDNDEGWSGHVTVKAGNDTSCLGTTVASSAAAVSTQKTTLVANAASAVTSASSAPSAPKTSDGAEAVGAAAAGLGNGAMSVGFSMGAVALSAFAGIAALAF